MSIYVLLILVCIIAKPVKILAPFVGIPLNSIALIPESWRKTVLWWIHEPTAMREGDAQGELAPTRQAPRPAYPVRETRQPTTRLAQASITRATWTEPDQVAAHMNRRPRVDLAQRLEPPSLTFFVAVCLISSW